MSTSDNKDERPRGETPGRRVLLKVSGEALMGDSPYGIQPAVVKHVATEVAAGRKTGVQMAVVVGGGNIFRGVSDSARDMERATADYVGMLATIMNAVAIQDALERQLGTPTRVMSAIEISQLAEPYIRRRAIRHLEKGRVVIFAAGTGNPFFTTDTAAALRAVEIQADVLLKATKVEGVYDKDPAKHSDAKLYRSVSYDDALKNDLRVMDSTAFALCRENKLPISVFDMNVPGNIARATRGDEVGTTITTETQTRFVEG